MPQSGKCRETDTTGIYVERLPSSFGVRNLPQLRPIDLWFITNVLPHESSFISAARRLTKDADAARDLVQDAFARLFTVEDWAAITAPKAYVMRIMHNIVVERVRRARIVRFEQLAALDAFEIVDDGPDAFRVVAARQEIERVGDALRSLPQRSQDVLTLRRVEDKSPREIAGLLGLSLSTLEKRLARAFHLLTMALDRDTRFEADSRVAEPPAAPGQTEASGG